MQFDYTRPTSAPEIFPGVPFVPVRLYHRGYEIEWAGVVDSGATTSLLRGEIPGLSAVALGFSWIDKTSDEARLLLGQMNFFQRFKVTFEAYKRSFDISLRPS